MLDAFADRGRPAHARGPDPMVEGSWPQVAAEVGTHDVVSPTTSCTTCRTSAGFVAALTAAAGTGSCSSSPRGTR